MDTLFREKIEPTPTQEAKAPEASQQAKPVVEVEVPYLDYQKQNSRPFVADHYNLGSTWDDPYGGFPVEVSAIESYLQRKIQDGEISNSQSAVKEELKKLEKITNVSKEDRALVKIETLAAYIKFLGKTYDIKYQLRRYGHS